MEAAEARDSRGALLAVVAFAALGALLRAALLFRDLDLLDRLFVPDDTYYTLSIARSLAAGNGPSADGVNATSGVQPLLAFLLVPVFGLSASSDAPLRAALAIGALADTINIVLLAGLLRRVDPKAAPIGAALWALSPVAIANAFGGLETSLALSTSMALVLLWWRAADRAHPRSFALAGAAAGVCLLTRVDTVFLVGLLGVSELLGDRRKGVLVAAGVAAAVVAPWWLYCAWRFGSIVPHSGAAVRELVRAHQSSWLGLPQQAAWAAGTCIGPPFADLPEVKQALLNTPWLGACLALSLAIALAVAARFVTRTSAQARPLALLVVHGLCLFGFYMLYLPAVWFFRRYLAPVHLVMALTIALGAAQLWRSQLQLARRAMGFALAAACTLALALSLQLWLVQPATSLDRGHNGVKGYREAARDVLALVASSAAPGGAVLGAFQSGALGYYAPPQLRVVNLDGVVDHEALAALQANRLGCFARARGVTHLADWPPNLDLIARRSRTLPPEATRLRVLGAAREQAGLRFVVAEIHWATTVPDPCARGGAP